jgi:hypothetical protein
MYSRGCLWVDFTAGDGLMLGEQRFLVQPDRLVGSDQSPVLLGDELVEVAHGMRVALGVSTRPGLVRLLFNGPRGVAVRRQPAGGAP